MTVVRYQRPKLYAKQEAAIFCPERYAVIEASTKAGKTHGCLAWAFEQTIKAKPGQNVWWVAPVYRQTKIAFRRTQRALRKGLPSSLYRLNETELLVEFAGAGTLSFLSGEKPDNLYGEDVIAAVIDEASRLREEAWHAIRSTLTATRGPVRIIGNVKGRKNWAYVLARKAETGEPNMRYSKLTAYDAVEAGVLDAEEVEDAKRQLPPDVFRQLYLAEPADDEGNPFGGSQTIRARIAPLSDAPPVAVGWDLAKSVDWSVRVALDKAGQTCGFERFQLPWPETEQRISASVPAGVPVLIDSTGVGDPVVDRLQRKHRNIEGFKFSSTSKQQLMEGLAVAIQSGTVSYPEGPIVTELDQFEYVFTRTGVKYSAPAGMHDDCVMALALAVRAKTQPKKGGGGMVPRPW